MRIRNLLTKPIVLIGMVGSGKSTIGKNLAKKLNLQFYDSDKVIEQREGLEVIDIHDFKGVNYFQKQEQEIIDEILNYGVVILSTGGSSFLNPNIRKMIKERAISIWLDADVETLLQRVSRRNVRPELRGKDPKEALEKMISEYYDIYAEADIKIQSDESDKHFVIDTIVSRLSKYLQDKRT